MTTLAAVVADARNYLMGTTHDATNKLNTTLSDTTGTSVVFTTNDTKILPAVGSTFEIETEIFYVTAQSSTTSTVIRGYLGSTAATHTSGLPIRIDPKFYDAVLFRQLQGELLDLSSPANGLFKQSYVDLTFNAAVQGYDLAGTTTVDDVLDVRFKTTGPQKSWPRAEFELARNMPTTDFASGNAIIVKRGGQAGQTIRVFYKAPYGAVTSLSDTLESTAGMHAEAVDIPAMGVALRAQSGNEIARVQIQSQGTTRRAAEVREGANNAAPAGLRALRQTRIQAEAARLAARWPGFGRYT